MYLSAHEGALHPALSWLQLIHITLATWLSCSALSLLAQLWFLCFFPSTSAYPSDLLLLSPVALSVPQCQCTCWQPQKTKLSSPMALLHAPTSEQQDFSQPNAPCLTQERQQRLEFDRTGCKINSPCFAFRLKKNKDMLKTACSGHELVNPSQYVASQIFVQLHRDPPQTHISRCFTLVHKLSLCCPRPSCGSKVKHMEECLTPAQEAVTCPSAFPNHSPSPAALVLRSCCDEHTRAEVTRTGP